MSWVTACGGSSTKDADTWRVSPARAEDAELVHQIMCAAYLEYVGTVDPPMSATEESAAQVADALGRGGAVLAWDGAAPVGSARYRISGDCVHIKRVSVLPEWRGRGIARAILLYIEDLGRRHGCSRARLQVRMSLSRNVKLYRRAGYQLINIKPHPRGQDTVGTLVKELAGQAREEIV